MTIEVSEQEREMIQEWYESAAGESCTTYGLDQQELLVLAALLAKLQIPVHSMDALTLTKATSKDKQ